MNLKEYSAKERGALPRLASEVGKAYSFLWQIANGIRNCPIQLCASIERATNGSVRCEDLRPDVDWALLRGTKG